MIEQLIAMLAGAGESNAHRQGGESGFGTARSLQDALDPGNIGGGSSSSFLGNIIDPGNVFGANPQLSANGNPRVNGGSVAPGSVPTASSMLTGVSPQQSMALMSAYQNFMRNLGVPGGMPAQPRPAPQPYPMHGALQGGSGTFGQPVGGGGPQGGGYSGLAALSSYLSSRQPTMPMQPVMGY